MLIGMAIRPFSSILVSLEFSLFGRFCQFASLQIMYGWSVTACAGMYQCGWANHWLYLLFNINREWHGICRGRRKT